MFVFIKTIAILTLTGSITFLIFLLSHALLKNKQSASLVCWGIVILSLLWLVPISFIFMRIMPTKTVSDISGIHLPPVLSDISNGLIESSISSGITYLYWIGGIYGAIVIVFFLRFLIKYRKQRETLLKNSWEINNPDDNQCLEKLMGQLRVKRKVKLRYSPLTKTPILVGVFYHYQIILPNYTLQDEQLELVLQHELIHLKRNDNLLKVYFELLKCIHWFNPIVYLMQRIYDTSCELSCDEQIISNLNLQQRKQYSLLILELVQYGQNLKACSGLNQNTTLLKERLMYIVQFKKSTKWIRALSAILISFICITGCGLSIMTDKQTQISTPEVKKDINLESTEKNNDVQKPIETFSWEKRLGEDRITLIINGTEYTFKALDNGSAVASNKDLSLYLDALISLPKEDLPEDLIEFLYYK